jgi:hypothetical protein
MIKKGDAVEFTDNYYQNYPPKDKSVIKFGVALEDENDGTVKVETSKGIEIARYIYAYAWSGWMPEDLEEIYCRINADKWEPDESW